MPAARPYESGHWDAVVTSWRETPGASVLRAYSDAVNRRLLERWLPPRCGRVLKTDAFDEAVAEGLVPFLAARADAVTAIDASAEAVAAARRRHPELDARVADVRALPFDDGSFDVVVSTSTLDHFGSRDEVGAALRELHRVLAPGGLAVVTLDNPRNPLVALRNALPLRPLARIGLVPYYVGPTLGPRGLRAALEGAGFAVEEVAAVMHVPRVAARALRPSLRLLLAGERLSRSPTQFLTGQFVAARARKP
jgi:SAM-dependent methyltransferase